MDTLLQNLRQGVRQLLRAPGFSLIAILTLGLGIGANTAIFSVVRGVLLRPLEYRDADRLVAIFSDERGGAEARNPTSPANFLDWSKESRSFEAMTAAQPWTPTLTGADAPIQIRGLKATPSLFSLLGVNPFLGRTFPPGDAVGTLEHVVVLGYGLWTRQFGADRAIVGRQIVLNGESYTVAGVMPPTFQFPPFWATGAEFWVPLTFTPEAAADRSRTRPDPGAADGEAESDGSPAWPEPRRGAATDAASPGRLRDRPRPRAPGRRHSARPQSGPHPRRRSRLPDGEPSHDAALARRDGACESGEAAPVRPGALRAGGGPPRGARRRPGEPSAHRRRLVAEPAFGGGEGDRG